MSSTFLGLSGRHLPPRVFPPALRSYSCYLQPGLGNPHCTARTQLDHTLPMLSWRRQGLLLAEEADRSRDSLLLHWMEPLTRHLAETIYSAYSKPLTCWLTSPDPWNSRVGSPVGYSKSQLKRSQHAQFGASLRRQSSSDLAVPVRGPKFQPARWRLWH